MFDGSGPPTALRPVYQQIGQLGADVQVAQGAWLFKGELINRSRPDAAYQAAVGRLEYGIARLFGSVSDISLLAEYQFDNGYYGFSNVGGSPALRDDYRDSHLTITLRRYL